MTPLAIQNINPNLEKFLFLITETEGTDRQGTPYNELFGYGNFNDYSSHPNIKITSGGYTSTAAGRYQILKGTYDSLGMKDFTPLSQDKAAIQLIINDGAYNDVINGDFATAIAKTNKTWASLPGSPYGQPTYTMQRAMNFLNSLVVRSITYAKKNPVKTGIVVVAAIGIVAYSTWLIVRHNPWK